jgi:hypothetical protein
MCPLSPCIGWLISSEHRNCFDYKRQVWRFVCPDCRHGFEISNDAIPIRSLPEEVLKQGYPGLIERRKSGMWAQLVAESARSIKATEVHASPSVIAPTLFHRPL